MDMKLTQPYFYVMLQSIQRTAEIFLSKLSKVEPYETREGTYAQIYTGLFNRLNQFWCWVITDLMEKDLYRVKHAELNQCVQAIVELLEENCNDLDKWMYVEHKIESAWHTFVPGNTIDFGLIIEGLEQLGDIEMANEAKRAQVIGLIATLLRHLAIAYRLALQCAEMTNISHHGQGRLILHAGGHGQEAALALLYLSAPDALMLRGAVLSDDMSLTIKSITVRIAMTSCGTTVLDKLCELQLLRRIP